MTFAGGVGVRVNVALETPPHALNEAIAATAAAAVPNIRSIEPCRWTTIEGTGSLRAAGVAGLLAGTAGSGVAAGVRLAGVSSSGVKVSAREAVE